MSHVGPNEHELALARCARSKIHLLEVQEILRRALAEEREADQKAIELGITPPRISLDRELHAAWQVHRGDAFWDRDPADPTPLRVAR